MGKREHMSEGSGPWDTDNRSWMNSNMGGKDWKGCLFLKEQPGKN